MPRPEEIEASKLVAAIAERLRTCKLVNPPPWIWYVKSGMHRERAPADPEAFWYARCASLLRKLYFTPMGVARFRKIYGGRKKRGAAPERKALASGAIIRRALQQLESAGLVQKGKKGRELSPKGISFINAVAKELK